MFAIVYSATNVNDNDMSSFYTVSFIDGDVSHNSSTALDNRWVRDIIEP